jgi:2-amino-4-hydroxy-6-hydroxymethyldihydropteridine diphosphokinase
VSTATLGLGANLGDRLATLQRAVDLLADEGVRATRSSRVWETEPVGGPQGQPPYLNAVVRADVGDLAPEEVLAAANRVEAALGRVRTERWGPRTIDIDVLLIDDLVRNDPALTIPHPRMSERAFVVMPLLDIDPDPMLPDGRRLLDVPLGDHAVRPIAPPLVLPRTASSGGSGGAAA